MSEFNNVWREMEGFPYAFYYTKWGLFCQQLRGSILYGKLGVMVALICISSLSPEKLASGGIRSCVSQKGAI